MELSKYQILAKAKIGFEVTFLSKGKFNDIIDGLKNNAIGMVFNEYDAGGPNICALTKLMDGRYKLETPIFDYTKAKVCLSSFLTYIKNNAKTDDRCFLKKSNRGKKHCPHISDKYGYASGQPFWTIQRICQH